MNIVRLAVLTLEGGFMACQADEFKGGDIYFGWVVEAIITKSPWAIVRYILPLLYMQQWCLSFILYE